MEYRDIPVEKLEQDEFGIEKYVKALCSFIKSCDTPISIALQGEWGSGKSSYMKIIENCLCGEDVPQQERYESIWLNTWELFLENSYEKAVQKLIFSLISQMEEHFDKLVEKKNAEKRKATLKNCLKTFSGVVLDIVNLSGGHGDELLNKAFSSQKSGGSIRKAKESFDLFLTNEVEEKQNGVTDQAFLIFVDDLDRLEPKMAVTLLEALKNLFDIKKCIFILAIDYDVVACGIEQKYGRKNINNRNIQQDFFDKLIQVPYVIPMARYQIGPMVMHRLRKMNCFEREYDYERYRDMLESIVKLATNKNPRSIKRLMNMMQLMLAMDLQDGEDQSCSPEFRTLELLLMAMQLSFPQVYDMICQNSNLEQWYKEGIVDGVEIPKYIREQYQLDESWKEMIYLAVAQDDVVRQNYYRVTGLLEIYERLQNRCQRNGERVEQALGIINVVSKRSVKETEILYDGDAYDKSSQTQQEQGRYLIDTTDFSDCRHVLDIGCGSGKTTIAMWQKNKDMQVMAFDVSDSQVNIARENYGEFLKQEEQADCRGGIRFTVLDVLQMKEQNKYDLVFSNAAMHWIPEPRKAYQLLFEALVPGGELAVHQGGFGTYDGLHQAARVAIERVGFSERFKNWSFPVFYPKKAKMEEMLREIGFENIRVESVSSDETGNTNLVENFTNASLIYYKRVGLNDEEYEILKNEFLHICNTEMVERRAVRLYVHAYKPLRSEGLQDDGAV